MFSYPPYTAFYILSVYDKCHGRSLIFIIMKHDIYDLPSRADSLTIIKTLPIQNVTGNENCNLKPEFMLVKL
ncbi:hypothetical protein J2W91_002242 [Paenibacillus amylolyticus]|uniref:Uncharacterized protein n=1 Tax=Paenibacillus amylolyticus TaxID=1451 RepID=A0AAP5H088_PAEAM|nr:hypothetical protein [Paenibacillus amylolyticus]